MCWGILCIGETNDDASARHCNWAAPVSSDHQPAVNAARSMPQACQSATTTQHDCAHRLSRQRCIHARHTLHRSQECISDHLSRAAARLLQKARHEELVLRHAARASAEPGPVVPLGRPHLPGRMETGPGRYMRRRIFRWSALWRHHKPAASPGLITCEPGRERLTAWLWVDFPACSNRML